MSNWVKLRKLPISQITQGINAKYNLKQIFLGDVKMKNSESPHFEKWWNTAPRPKTAAAKRPGEEVRQAKTPALKRKIRVSRMNRVNSTFSKTFCKWSKTTTIKHRSEKQMNPGIWVPAAAASFAHNYSWGLSNEQNTSKRSINSIFRAKSKREIDAESRRTFHLIQKGNIGMSEHELSDLITFTCGFKKDFHLPPEQIEI